MATVTRLSFSDGVVSALQVLYSYDGGCTAIYDEIVRSHGPDQLCAAAKRAGNYRGSGLLQWAKERRDRERREAKKGGK